MAEEGVTAREMAGVIGKGLDVPVASLSPHEAFTHFGWLGAFVGLDMPASGAWTRDQLGWRPDGPGLISDLQRMDFGAAAHATTWTLAAFPYVRITRSIQAKTMTEQAHSTLPREAKGSLAPPPMLQGDLKAVAEAVAAWPEVAATTHWHFADPSRVDGVDFYVGPDELGHLHLDGSIHLATTPGLSATLVAEGLGTPFPYARGWTQASVARLGRDGATAFLRRNYDRLRPATAPPL